MQFLCVRDCLTLIYYIYYARHLDAVIIYAKLRIFMQSWKKFEKIKKDCEKRLTSGDNGNIVELSIKAERGG